MNIRTVVVAIASLPILSLPFTGQVKLSPADKHFMTMAAEVNMTEAHLGQMAQENASQGDIKDFGQTLTKDHSMAYGELLEVAGKIHEQVPRGIDIHKDSEFRQLVHLKGTSFDRTFLGDEIREHQKVLAEFKRESEHGENPEIKNYAKAQIPVIEQHLEKAEGLAKTIKHRS